MKLRHVYERVHRRGQHQGDYQNVDPLLRCELGRRRCRRGCDNCKANGLFACDVGYSRPWGSAAFDEENVGGSWGGVVMGTIAEEAIKCDDVVIFDRALYELKT